MARAVRTAKVPAAMKMSNAKKPATLKAKPGKPLLVIAIGMRKKPGGR